MRKQLSAFNNSTMPTGWSSTFRDDSSMFVSVRYDDDQQLCLHGRIDERLQGEVLLGKAEKNGRQEVRGTSKK